MPLYIGIDVGTQATKAVVYDSDGRAVVGRGAMKHVPIRGLTEGAFEQDPATWLDAVYAAVPEALADVDRTRVRGLGVSGQQHGFVALDGDGAVIRPAKLWCDTETAPEAEELSARLGRPIPAGFTASKVLWLARHEPENFARLACALLPHDWVNLQLTGRGVCEAGDASGTGYFDPIGRVFDPVALGALSDAFEECLPPLVEQEFAIGTLRPEIAREWDLPDGVLVAPGSGDNMMSALGAGAVRPGVLVMSLGTSGTLFAQSEHAVVDPDGLVAPFCDALGLWLPLLCTLNCTTVTEEVRALFGLDHAHLTVLAAAEPPGCRGVGFLPFLAGERTPDWPTARGALLGLRAGSLRPGTLYRAAIEGATFALLGGLDRLRALGVEAEEIRLVGGGSNNELWRQIVADASGLPVRLPAEAEAAALGGALQAAAIDASEGETLAWLRDHAVPLRQGSVDPVAAHRAAYADAAARHHEAAQRLFGTG